MKHRAHPRTLRICRPRRSCRNAVGTSGTRYNSNIPNHCREVACCGVRKPFPTSSLQTRPPDEVLDGLERCRQPGNAWPPFQPERHPPSLVGGPVGRDVSSCPTRHRSRMDEARTLPEVVPGGRPGVLSCAGTNSTA
jgi:hypothetical protein